MNLTILLNQMILVNQVDLVILLDLAILLDLVSFVNLVILVNVDFLMIYMKLVVMVKTAKLVILIILLIQLNLVIIVNITKLVILIFLVEVQEINTLLVFCNSYFDSINFTFSFCLKQRKESVLVFYFWYGKLCLFKIMQMVVAGSWRQATASLLRLVVFKLLFFR